MHLLIIKKKLPCGISSKPTAASTSSKDDIDVIDEMDCLIFSRSDRLLLGAGILIEKGRQRRFYLFVICEVTMAAGGYHTHS